MVMGVASLVAALLASTSPSVPVQQPNCSTLLPAAADLERSPVQRPIATIDLARLRDVGRSEDGLWDDSPFGVSPDGTHVVFQIRQADPVANSYCLGMVVMDVRARGEPVVIDRGGQFLKGTMSIRGLAAFPLGTAKVIVPRWSPDGSAIAYLRSDDGPARLWLARADGAGARPLSSATTEIVDFRWSTNGSDLLIATRHSLAAAEAGIALEGRSGFHFDNRFSPAVRARPFVREPIPTQWSAIDPVSGAQRPATPGENLTISGGPIDPRLPAGPKLVSHGSAAWSAASTERYGSPRVLKVMHQGGEVKICDDPSCIGLLTFGWMPDGKSLWYVRRAGWSAEDMSLHIWVPGEKPRLRYKTVGILSGCTRADVDIICTQDSSNQPMQIVRISTVDGHRTVLFDLNPEFRAITLGPVQRLQAKNRYGIESFADLVLPPGHRPGQRHPLVVVQYQSRGFLRGGTGDEAPIFALAAQGLAVLSFNRPKDYFEGPAGNWEAYLRAILHDRIDRRSILSSLDALLDDAIATGTVDPARLGIWGLSDGASTAQYALLNSRHAFQAVSLATCCEDPNTYELLGGPVLQDWLSSFGYPSWGGAQDAWADYSIARNAARIKVPFLLQLSDSEYMKSLEMASALRALGRPVDMFVFPDERHIKWQPAHRLAIYNRNVDWFRFWLLDANDAVSAKPDEMARWIALKAARAQ